jgi:branched-chain amino acid transport system permease protein
MKLSSNFKTIVKDSLFTGLISLALFGPIVGLKTSSKGQGLFVTPHVGIVVLLVAACVVGRFLIGLNSLRKKEISFLANITSKVGSYMDNKGKHFAITGVLFAIIFPFLPFTDRY